MNQRSNPPGCGYELPAGVSLAMLLRQQFATQASQRAVHIDSRWLSFAELGELAFSGANALRAVGIGLGDRVGTLLPNNRAFLTTWLGASEIGATLVPVNINLAGDTLRYIVEHAGLHLLIIDATVFQTYSAAFGETLPARRAIAVGGDLPGASRYEAILASAGSDPPPLLQPANDEPALIVYTSGTTGRPKGVVLSRAAQLAHGWYYGKDFVRLGPGENSYTCLPLFHVTSMGFSLGSWLGGAAIAIDTAFNPFRFWSEVRRHDARVFPYLGAMISMLAARPERSDDASVPALRAVGAATPITLWEPFERRFGLTLIETYGQSETASLWFMPPSEGRKIGTTGKPVSRLEAYILGDNGSPAPPDTVGEIMLRPRDPLLMTQGYFRDEETTRRVFRDGWYATGDAGSMDKEGYLRFAGRLKDFIRRRGENISAFEVEHAALTHPTVKEAAAVGVPSDLGEEEIKLCLLLHDGAELQPAAFARYLRARLAGFMLPRYIEIRDNFPRTATQRVQKFRLVEEGVTAKTWDRQRRTRDPRQ